MIRYDAGTTNPTLLDGLCDWRDHETWVDFVTRYDPVIRLSFSILARLPDRVEMRVPGRDDIFDALEKDRRRVKSRP